MKRRVPMLANLVCVLFIATFGVATASHFDTGDKDLDANLEKLNVEAKTDLKGFKLDMGTQFGVEQATIDAALKIEKMEPAEVYLALELSFLSGKPLETVLNIYKNNRGKGWGVVAQTLGIKPGSDAFKQLKASVSKKSDKSFKKETDKSVSKESDKKEQKKDVGAKSVESKDVISVEASKEKGAGKEKDNKKDKK